MNRIKSYSEDIQLQALSLYTKIPKLNQTMLSFSNALKDLDFFDNQLSRRAVCINIIEIFHTCLDAILIHLKPAALKNANPRSLSIPATIKFVKTFLVPLKYPEFMILREYATTDLQSMELDLIRDVERLLVAILMIFIETTRVLNNAKPSGIGAFRDTPLSDTKYKTQLCRNFQETGSCEHGTMCNFAHGTGELVAHH